MNRVNLLEALLCQSFALPHTCHTTPSFWSSSGLFSMFPLSHVSIRDSASAEADQMLLPVFFWASLLTSVLCCLSAPTWLLSQRLLSHTTLRNSLQNSRYFALLFSHRTPPPPFLGFHTHHPVKEAETKASGAIEMQEHHAQMSTVYCPVLLN